MQTDSSAIFTWSVSLSTVEYTATQGIPISCAVRITRTAISPLFATKIFSALQVTAKAPQCFLDLCLTWSDRNNFLGKFTRLPIDRLHGALLIPLVLFIHKPCHPKNSITDCSISRDNLYQMFHENYFEPDHVRWATWNFESSINLIQNWQHQNVRQVTGTSIFNQVPSHSYWVSKQGANAFSIPFNFFSEGFQALLIKFNGPSSLVY